MAGSYDGGPGNIAGNINLTNGATTLLIEAGDLVAFARPGDLLWVEGESAIAFIASIAPLGDPLYPRKATLQYPWEGATITEGQPSPPKWSIRNTGPAWNSNVPTNTDIAEIRGWTRTGGKLWPVDSAPTDVLLPSSRVGDFAFDVQGAAAIIYEKTALGWSTGTILVGNSVTAGAGVPNNANGEDADLYIRTSTGQVYEKQAGVWNVIAVITGATGPRGAAPTIVFTLDTGSTVGTGIGAGEVRFSNANINTISMTLFFSTTQQNGGDVAALIDLWGTYGSATERGLLYGYNPLDPTKWVAYRVTGSIVTQTGRREVSCTRRASNPASGAIGVDASDLAWQFTPTGTQGLTGAQGVTPGRKFAFRTDAANSDPGNGGVKLDNASLGAVTLLRIDDLDLAGQNAEAFIQSITSSNAGADRARIELRDATSGAVSLSFVVTGSAIDRTGWWDIPVSGGSGTIPPDLLTIALNVYPTGPQGIQGAPGANGTDPGWLYLWDDATIDADPGNGELRANNANLSAATFLYVSKTNRTGNDLATQLLSMNAPINAIKGSITLSRSSDDAQAVYSVTGVTDAVNYIKIAVTAHSGITDFVAGDPISFQYGRSGNAGVAGGVQGPAGGVATGELVAFADGTGSVITGTGLQANVVVTQDQAAVIAIVLGG